MKLAYPYVRFSSHKQEKSSSVKRQLEMARGFCKAKGWKLVEDVDLTDTSKSASKGEHLRRGKLGDFVAQCEAGQIPKGSVLVIEKLDRLARLPISETEKLVARILATGVEICSIAPELHLLPTDMDDYTKRMMLLSLAQGAYQYTKDLGERVHNAWKTKREKLKEGHKLTRKVPFWLQANDDRTAFKKIPAQVKLVKQMFKLAIEDNGIDRIIKEMGGGYTRKLVHRTLHNRAVLGEYQPKSYGEDAGKVIKDYFPRIIDDTTFAQAHAALNKRKRSGGPRGKQVANLFTGLIYDKADGERCHFTLKNAGRPALVSYGAIKRTTKTYFSFPYLPVEDTLLYMCWELLPLVFADNSGLPSQIAELDQAQQGRALTIEQLKARFRKSKSPAILDLIEQEEAEFRTAAQTIEQLRAQLANTGNGNAHHIMDLIDAMRKAKGEKLTELRQTVKARLAQIIQRVDCDFWGGKLKKGAKLMITFVNGQQRYIELEYDAQWHRGKAWTLHATEEKLFLDLVR